MYSDNDDIRMTLDGRTVRGLKEVLAHIASKDWRPQPRIVGSSVLIERSSWHCRGDMYTLEDIRMLYEHLGRTQELKPFSDMTAVDFLEALELHTIVRRAA